MSQPSLFIDRSDRKQFFRWLRLAIAGLPDQYQTRRRVRRIAELVEKLYVVGLGDPRDEGWAYISQKDLEEYLGICERTVRDQITLVRDLGWIAVERRLSGNRYRVDLEALRVAADEPMPDVNNTSNLDKNHLANFAGAPAKTAGRPAKFAGSSKEPSRSHPEVIPSAAEKKKFEEDGLPRSIAKGELANPVAVDRMFASATAYGLPATAEWRVRFHALATVALRKEKPGGWLRSRLRSRSASGLTREDLQAAEATVAWLDRMRSEQAHAGGKGART